MEPPCARAAGLRPSPCLARHSLGGGAEPCTQITLPSPSSPQITAAEAAFVVGFCANFGCVWLRLCRVMQETVRLNKHLRDRKNSGAPPQETLHVACRLSSPFPHSRVNSQPGNRAEGRAGEVPHVKPGPCWRRKNPGARRPDGSDRAALSEAGSPGRLLLQLLGQHSPAR